MKTYSVYYQVFVEDEAEKNHYIFYHEVLHIKSNDEKLDSHQIEDCAEKIIKHKYKDQKVIHMFIDV